MLNVKQWHLLTVLGMSLTDEGNVKVDEDVIVPLWMAKYAFKTYAGNPKHFKEYLLNLYKKYLTSHET